MNAQMAREYRQFRAAGMRAEHAIDAARTEIQWNRLERAGLVILDAREEEQNYFDVYGEPDTEKERESIRHYLETWGCYCVMGRYSLKPITHDADWDWNGEIGDSVGMCVYDDPKDARQNWYVTDIKQTTIRALVDALKSRCPTCRKPQ